MFAYDLAMESNMPKLIGLNWDERTAWEIEQKGWCEQVKLQMDDGTLVALSIYVQRDYVRRWKRNSHRASYFSQNEIS